MAAAEIAARVGVPWPVGESPVVVQRVLVIRMTSTLARVMSLTFGMLACPVALCGPTDRAGSWLDEPSPASWNEASLPIPAAPRSDGNMDPRCKALARPSELDEDKLLRNRGWDLVGTFQGGWRILVVQGAAGYDGMCRPRQYQDFVFVRGVFAGTLSPHAMDSRTDGALTRVTVQSDTRLTAEYARYDAKDPLCCPSRTTSVVFEVANEPPILRALSTSTSKR